VSFSRARNQPEFFRQFPKKQMLKKQAKNEISLFRDAEKINVSGKFIRLGKN
jgi:hypothetical protein